MRRIVGCAYRVDVVSLHKCEVEFERLARYGATEIRVVFVAIDATEVHRRAIDSELAVHDGHRSKTDCRLYRLTRCRNAQRVELRRFGCPGHGIRNLDFNPDRHR